MDVSSQIFLSLLSTKKTCGIDKFDILQESVAFFKKKHTFMNYSVYYDQLEANSKVKMAQQREFTKFLEYFSSTS